MITCKTCLSAVPDASRLCPSCGSPVSSGVDDATIAIEPTVGIATPTPSPAPARVSGSGSAAPRVHTTLPKAGRFHPGAILAGRYQIIGELGKGGMGEVYRANDLTLDQPVALKFLPTGMASNPAMLARFHGEVRIARQVSHPNVCRVYDIGEVDGQLFLSMEYVDGEDLASLLRRIGRLPADKAIEFARRICAGLAAAHDKGVLHRDLKPANIMIDSQGKVVIMDFGLAAVADQVQGLEIKAGTPAYMSPEQLAGREVSVRSDIYSLGLVLYEMFTGKRAFECSTLAELMKRQYETQALSLSTVAKDIDPSVERVIERCLAPDPKARPATALAVAAALPGGDPLAAALAAGETPSPELVARSGDVSGMRPLWAVLCGAAVLVGLVSVTVMSEYARLANVAPLELPPDALELKAHEYARSFGFTEKPVDTARGFLYDQDYLQYLEKQTQTPNRWARLAGTEPPSVVFWYRQSPRYLKSWQSPTGQITIADPPETVSGMIGMQLDTRGRMTAFTAVPPQMDKTPATVGPVDWKPLFTAAGLDMAQFKPTDPQWTPLAAEDERAAWLGAWPGVPNESLRVEGAAWRGKPVYFDLIGPWTRPSRMQLYQPSREEKTIQFALLTLAVAGLLGATLLARYNLRRDRGDRRGALRLAMFAFVLEMAIWILAGHHTPSTAQVVQLFEAISISLLIAAAFWVGYIAVEPYVRRHWPQAIVSWSRLAAGGLNDPLVGRDALLGVVFGVLWASIWAAGVLLDYKTSGPSTTTWLNALAGARFTVAMGLSVMTNSLLQLLVSFFILFLLRLLLRRGWLAGVAFVALFTAITAGSSVTPAVDIPLSILAWSTTYLAIARFGFITFVVGLYVNSLLIMLPVSADLTVWYSGVTVLVVLVVAGLTAYGIRTALSGRNLIADEFL